MPETQLPQDVIEEAMRLTRLARRAPETVPEGSAGNGTSLSEAETYREARDDLLADHDYTARVRTEDDDPILVCYPVEWVSDGTVDLDAIENTDRAVERRLDGTGVEAEYDTVADHNERIASAVGNEYGSPHGETATAFATFMANHRVRRLESATADDIQEFVTEYFPRNCWPSTAQRRVIHRSLRLTLLTARNH